VWCLGRLGLAQGFLIELGEVELPDTGLGVQVGDLLGLDNGSCQLGQVQVDLGGHRLATGLAVRSIQLHSRRSRSCRPPSPFGTPVSKWPS
jgi:hypothetical protein